MTTENVYNTMPHPTVATIVQKSDTFLCVIEESNGKKVYNQPAGHLEAGETLVEAAVRETLEESGWHVKPTHYLGVSHHHAANGVSYLRHSFVAQALQFDEQLTLDPDILGTQWLSYQELLSRREQLRSPLVLHDVERFRRGQLFPLDMLSGFL